MSPLVRLEVFYGVLGIATAAAALTVAVPLCLYFGRIWRVHPLDSLFTLKTALWSGSLALLLGWRSLIFLDYALNDQRLVGPISDRDLPELLILGPIVVAVWYATWLFHHYVTIPRFRRRRYLRRMAREAAARKRRAAAMDHEGPPV